VSVWLKFGVRIGVCYGACDSIGTAGVKNYDPDEEGDDEEERVGEGEGEEEGEGGKGR